MEMSYQVLSEQGGEDGEEELYKVNPELFRNLKYYLAITPDVLNPMSEDLERAYALETYDRAIQNPLSNQETITRDLLFATSPTTKKDPDKFMKKEGGMDMLQMASQGVQNGGSPLEAMSSMNQLSQAPMSSTTV